MPQTIVTKVLNTNPVNAFTERNSDQIHTLACVLGDRITSGQRGIGANVIKACTAKPKALYCVPAVTLQVSPRASVLHALGVRMSCCTAYNNNRD